MADSDPALFARFRKYLHHDAELGLSVDVSRIKFDDGFIESMRPRIAAALVAMKDLEAGAIANPDEKRRVGHYWLRAPELAPDADTRAEIESTLARILSFATAVHTGRIRPERAARFENLLVVGI